MKPRILVASVFAAALLIPLGASSGEFAGALESMAAPEHLVLPRGPGSGHCATVHPGGVNGTPDQALETKLVVHMYATRF